MSAGFRGDQPVSETGKSVLTEAVLTEADAEQRQRKAQYRRHRAEVERLEDLLVEALARIDVMEDGGGDYGGPYSTRDGYAVDMYVKSVSAHHSDPPDYDLDHDPLDEAPEDIQRRAAERAKVIRQRVRASVAAHAERTGHFKPWWGFSIVTNAGIEGTSR